MECLCVCQILNCEAVLQAPHFEIIVRRICRGLARLWASRWKPRRDIDPFILWAPREFNPTADYLVNLYMDGGHNNALDQEALRHHAHAHGSITVCVDGGLGKARDDRGNRLAAIGMELYSVDVDVSGVVVYNFLGRAAEKVTGTASAFQTETAALDWAVDLLCKCVM